MDASLLESDHKLNLFGCFGIIVVLLFVGVVVMQTFDPSSSKQNPPTFSSCHFWFFCFSECDFVLVECCCLLFFFVSKHIKSTQIVKMCEFGGVLWILEHQDTHYFERSFEVLRIVCDVWMGSADADSFDGDICVCVEFGKN